MIALAIMGTMLIAGLVSYKKLLLSSKFEEAKVTIQSIALAQERYKQKNRVYYHPSMLIIGNEDFISNDLKVDLSKSNNFDYKIYMNSVDKSYYTIRATLRYYEDRTCQDTFSIGTNCKQQGTLKRDEWVNGYSPNGNNHYIEFRFPRQSSSSGYFFTDKM